MLIIKITKDSAGKRIEFIYSANDNGKEVKISVPITKCKEDRKTGILRGCWETCPLFDIGLCLDSANDYSICEWISDSIGMTDSGINSWVFDNDPKDSLEVFRSLEKLLGKGDGIIKKRIFKRCQNLKKK